MEFGIAIPQMHADPVRIRRFLERAEDLPFVAAWCMEQVIGTAPVLESVTILTYAAAITKRLLLGIAVLLIAQRNPIDLAKALASLDVLSNGRLMVGVGLGASTRFYPAYGLQPEGRVSRFRENLEIIKRLWAHDRVTLNDRLSHLEGVPMEPKPVQNRARHLVWGSVEAALRRAVELLRAHVLHRVRKRAGGLCLERRCQLDWQTIVWFLDRGRFSWNLLHLLRCNSCFMARREGYESPLVVTKPALSSLRACGL